MNLSVEGSGLNLSDQLGLPTCPKVEQLADELTDSRILQLLREQPLDERHRLMARVLELGLAVDRNSVLPARAESRVLTPVERLLLYQSAVCRLSLEAYEEWLAAENQARSRKEKGMLQAEAQLTRCLLFGGRPSVTEGEFIPSNPVHAFVLRVAMIAEDRWTDLQKFCEGGSAASKLFAAHIAQDRLGNAALRSAIISELAPQLPIAAAEWQLDQALESGREDQLRQQLQLRYRILKDNKLSIQSEATAMFLKIRGSTDVAVQEELSPPQAAAAWKHLLFLSQAEQCGKAATDRCKFYLDNAMHATRLPLNLAAPYHVRAIELLMAQDRWAEALESLPKIKGDPVLSELVEIYSTVCLIKLGRWEQIAGILQIKAQEQKDEAERFGFLSCSLICALHGAHLHPVVGQIESTLQQMDRGVVLEIGRLLLALYGKHRNIEGLARVWGLLGERTDATAQALCFLSAGATWLAQRDVTRALNYFSSLSEKNNAINPVIAAATALAHIRQINWRAAIDSLQDMAQTLSGSAQTRCYTLAARIAWALGELIRARELLHEASPRNEDLNVALHHAAVCLDTNEPEMAANLLRTAAQRTPMAHQGNSLRCLAATLLAERPEGLREAEQLYRDVLQAEPTNLVALKGLNRLLMTTHRLEELPVLLSQRLRLVTAPSEKLPIHLQLAQISRELWAKNSNERNYAQQCIEHCEQALQIDPACEEAAFVLTETYADLGDWASVLSRRVVLERSARGLRALYRAAKDSDDLNLLVEIAQVYLEGIDTPLERGRVALEVANIYHHRKNDFARAEQFYRRSIDENPEQSALSGYAELLANQGRYKELAEILEQLLTSDLENERKVEVSLSLSQLYNDRLQRPEDARQHLESVTRWDPRNREALWGLERLYGAEPQRRLQVLERLLPLADDEEAELNVLLKIAGAHIELNNVSAQLAVARRLRTKFLNHPPVFPCIEDIYRRLQQDTELCELYEARCSALGASEKAREECVRLLTKKARIQMERLSAPVEAADTYLRILDLQAADEEVLTTIENLLKELSDWPRLATLYERHALRLTEPREKISYFHRAAKIAHYQLKDEAEAGRLYEQIYALDPTDPVAFSALERRLERQADHQRLTELLLDRSHRAHSASEKIDYLIQAANACENSQNVERAIQIYNTVISLHESCVPALDALSRIYESLERWQEFLNVTQKQLDLQRDPVRRALLYFKCGSVVETQFRNESLAYEYYSKAVKSSSACLPALHGLRDMQAKRGDWEAVAHTLAAEVRVWSDPKGKADVLAQLGEIYETHLGERTKALECYQRAIKTHPECMRAALALFRIYAGERNYVEAAQWGRIYARRGHLRGDTAERVQFYVQWTEVLLAVNRPKEAINALLRALELDPVHHNALYALLRMCRVYPEVHDFGETTTNLTQEALVREDQEAQAILSTTLGVLHEYRGDVETSLKLFRDSLRLGGQQFQLIRPLADLLTLMGEQDEAIGLVMSARAAAEVASFDHWVEATQWLGDCYLESGHYERALAMYAEILERQPNLYATRLQLAHASLLANQAENAERQLEQVAQHLSAKHQDVRTIANALHALGIAAAAANHEQKAESNWRRACELVPEWPYPYIALAKALHRSGSAQNAERELRVAEQSVAERSNDLLRAQAEFYAKQGFIERTITLYRKATQTPDPEVDDRVNLARHLFKHGDKDGAVALLRRIIRDDPASLWAYEEMSRIWSAQGHAQRSARAIQVVEVELAEKKEVQRSPIHAALSANGVQQVAATVRQSALGEAWELLRSEFKILFAQQPPATSLPVPPSIASAVENLRVTFGFEFQAVFCEDDLPVIQVFPEQIFLSKRVRGRSPTEVRALCATALSAQKLGFSLLFNLNADQRVTVAHLLALSLLPPERWSPELTKVIEALPRREQRQLAKVGTQYREGIGSGRTLAEEATVWLAGVERLLTCMALLVTDDLVAVSRALALRRDIAATAYEEGGLLILPEVQSLCDYFISDDFDQQRSWLVGQ